MYKDKLNDEFHPILKKLEKAVLEDKKYSSYFSDHKERYKSDLQNIKKFFIEGEILEIGSLPCHLTYCLKSLGYSVIGLDINPERAASFIKQHDLDIVKCDIEKEKFPFDNNRFGLILFNEVFEHLRIDPIFTLQEIYRVIKHGGILILTTPNLYSLENILSYLLGKGLAINSFNEFKKLQNVGHMGHIKEYSTSEIKNFLQNMDFQLIMVKYKTYNRSRKGYLADLCYYMFPFWRPYQIVISKKLK